MAGPGRRGARGRAGALRPLHPDGRVQRRSSTSASSSVAGPAVADRVPLPRPDLHATSSTSTWAALRFELHHARGETDDHTWTWMPERAVLCCGDLFIWASPNAGNPQKVQRYPASGRSALREMAALEPEVLLPGHGLPVVGAERVPPGAHRHRRAARLARRPDARAHERGRPPRRGDPHRAGAARTCWSGPTSGPSTTSPSSWCATCGACTAAGTTATRRTSSRHPRRPWPRAGRVGGRGRPPRRPRPRPGGVPRSRGGPRERCLCVWPGHLAELAALAAPSDPAVHRSPTPRCSPGVEGGHVDHGQRGLHLDGPGLRGTGRTRPRRRRGAELLLPDHPRGLASVVAVSPQRRRIEQHGRRHGGVAGSPVCVAVTALPFLLGGCSTPHVLRIPGVHQTGPRRVRVVDAER